MSEEKSLRVHYGEALLALGRSNDCVVVLDADVSKGTYTNFFAHEFPERFFNFGVAEQNMIGSAVGLATTGLISFANTYAVFLMRAIDQVRNYVAFTGLNVKIVVGHGGVSVGEDGPTHMGTEDIAMMRSIPGMIVLVPGDAFEVRESVLLASKHQGPVYIRLAKVAIPSLDCEEPLEIGKGRVIREGDDLTIVACGTMVTNAVEAAYNLIKKNIKAKVISMSSVKPIDRSLIIQSAKETGAIVTAEDHNIIGGLGSAVCEVLADSAFVPVERVGLKDTFGQSGSPEELYEYYGFTPEAIAEVAERVLQRKLSKI